jgi:N-acetylglutamate synthase-like GNAT family acetyltransferase
VSVSIRVATADDFDAICDLVVLLKLIADRSRITNTLVGSSYWIAESASAESASKEPIGCIGLEHGKGASLVRSAAVRPEYQGQGIGDQLANVVLNAAVDRGDHKLFLFSTGAYAFWKRYGFEEVSVWTLADELPNVAQVRSGIERGWIADDRAWMRML